MGGGARAAILADGSRSRGGLPAPCRLVRVGWVLVDDTDGDDPVGHWSRELRYPN